MEHAAAVAICNLPAIFAGGNKSFVQIVREAGVTKANLTAQPLLPLLRADPDLVQGWLLWSMNKRVSSGWFFQQQGTSFVVGFHPGEQRAVFPDAASGCAEFIIKEIAHAL